MKKNAGIKVLTGAVVAVVILIVITIQPAPNKDMPVTPDHNNVNQAIASQFNDNIRDVSARLIKAENKMRVMEQQNKALSLQNSTRQTAGNKMNTIVNPSTSPEVLASIASLKSELARMKDVIKDKPIVTADYPVDEVTHASHTATHPIKDIDALLMKKPLSEQETSYWNQFNKRRANRHTSSKTPVKTGTRLDKKIKNIPYYTIPAGADLGHTTLLSALIGEVPNEGKLMQPLFPFTAIISRGDLMASNGVPIPPDVSGMKVSGYAIGVGSFLDNISCVRAYVTSALFTFQDGHFVVVGKEQMKNTSEMVNNESLGYLTTRFGNPCIHGKYFTNAPRVLGAMMGAGGVQGVGEALSQWQMSYFSGPAGGAAVPTGSFGKYAAGGALSSGTVKAADWLEKHIQGSFDMVFVPASTPYQVGNQKFYRPTQVSFHLTQTIAIDKQPNGRVLDYGHLQTYTRDFSLR